MLIQDFTFVIEHSTLLMMFLILECDIRHISVWPNGRTDWLDKTSMTDLFSLRRGGLRYKKKNLCTQEPARCHL